MRRSIVSTMVLLLVAACALSASAQAVDDEQAIRVVVETWRRASERADAPAIDLLLAPDYQLSRPGGIRASREATMRGVRRDSAAIADRGRTGDGRQNEITYTDIVVRQYGDLAVVTYHSHYRPLLNPDAGESDHETMRVLRRRDGHWRIVDGHGVYIPKSCQNPKVP